MSNQIISLAKEKMTKAVSAFSRELATVRAGRANPAILDKVLVEYYGAPTPINQMANISVPEARLLLITPYDKTVINDMDKAIQKADLGLNPSNDGTVIRISFPPLTEERRRDLVKVVKKSAEDAKVAVRNIRRDANDDLKKAEKNGEITEDELRGLVEDIQKQTDSHIEKIDGITKEKEKEIMEV